jgi:hypothetical protein
MYVWCETWFSTLRRIGVFENRVLKKILASNREEVMGGRRKLCNEELRDLYLPFDIIWGIKRKEDIMKRVRRTYGENKTTRFLW